MPRNYKKNTLIIRVDQIKKKRAMRNKARRIAERSGRVTKGSGFDIHHRDGNPMNSDPNNLVVVHQSTNRSLEEMVIQVKLDYLP